VLFWILLAFVLGLFLGYYQKVQWLRKPFLIPIITAFLLFVMGFEIGNDEKLFQDLPDIGLWAMSIAFFSAGGSFLFAGLYGWIHKLRRKSVE
jgi:O-antigen/teichoic acid export membrane protein